MSGQQPASLADDARDHFRWRVIQDAWADANAAYWERRARQLEAARPRSSDFTGRASSEDLRAAWDRLTAAAAACRARGQLLELSRDQAQETLTDLATGVSA